MCPTVENAIKPFFYANDPKAVFPPSNNAINFTEESKVDINQMKN